MLWVILLPDHEKSAILTKLVGTLATGFYSLLNKILKHKQISFNAIDIIKHGLKYKYLKYNIYF